MLADIEPVHRESTASIIARQLRDAIMNGSLPPGTQLGETDLAARFEVSRGPLREAMQRLVSEGLLRSERHRGLFVIELEPGDVHDIYGARWAVERAAAIQVVRGNETSRIAARLADAVQAMAQAEEEDDPAALAEADLTFHETLIEASGSRRLVRMARTLLIETRMCLSALQSTYRKNYQGVDERIAEHNRIIEALRDRDEKLVLELLEAHMEDAVRRLAPGTTLTSGSAEGKQD
ncbi:DNA-binding GntR family transcriptional regulator [Saccharomonospora amisosensis]|uniref:DNA-binding GntR family transcriptional regulator n=1 Tax=Saccharomonospora amisosensis TaxID=1128677 RepID=A0A7X5UND2_9PSEU|nr:GntR family transcriptional regulator [Saccharomonospora amisosensis]NIJ10829.1 DNA-binding GntR family transcriptional regulator [Saccharomonospora amisosensis]